MQDLSYKHARMTYRDLEILRLMAAGHPDGKICELVRMREADYQTAVELLYQKIGVKTRREAVELALREGWIESGGES
jgi:DNA-binding CsgD family transcriptional regulator